MVHNYACVGGIVVVIVW